MPPVSEDPMGPALVHATLGPPLAQPGASALASGAVGALVREWRLRRKRSQLDLALDAGMSARHLSFIETGRSRPSPEALDALGEALAVPLRTRNVWLMAAGHAPRYSEQQLDSARMVQVRAAVQRLLDTHDPYPGVALDRAWNVVLHNRAAERLLALLPEALLRPRINVFRISLHPQGLAAHTRNFAAWGQYLLQLLERLRQSRDEQLDAVAREVLDYPNVRSLLAAPLASPGHEPALLVPCELDLAGQALSLFTTLTTFGSPRDITLHELCVELFYPSDAATAQALRALAEAGR